VLLDDSTETPLGFVRATRMDTLAAARIMIEQLVERAPKRYHFICAGAPVSTAQESQIYAADLAPSLVLRPLPDDGATPTTGAKTPEIELTRVAELQRRLEEAEAAREAAVQTMLQAQSEADHAKAQLREMAERLAAFENRLNIQQPSPQ